MSPAELSLLLSGPYSEFFRVLAVAILWYRTKRNEADISSLTKRYNDHVEGSLR